MNLFRFLGIAFDALLPRRRRRERTELRTLEDISLTPASHELLGMQVVTIMDYKESSVRELIQSLKYDNSGHAARLCAAVLEDYLREEVAAKRNYSPKKILIVPVPLHARRIRERGFNQIERILNHLSPEFQNGQLSTVYRALLRTRETKLQTHLSREERVRNVADAFALSNLEQVKDTQVFLIDDVTTTGATLVEASKPLIHVGVNVTLLALARA